ncbi:hypothetical protein WICPIJ_004920 [Wickerhamomyces pijperi]|uniref:Uncharacterized protein n=1 Tax=Wickerhamomyces pijperi TaxID=599730 RepID=A0A9P8TMF9_WICPI|nr:hypothetical protein WICPIJ_004920 [Wickerhamomyces pijperi]
MLHKRNPNLPPTNSNSNKSKTKSKKYEIYSNATETKNAIPLMKNRKNVEFRLSRDSKSSQIHDFSDEFQAKLISWTSIPTTDMFCLRSMFKVKAGEITYKECNKEIREFEKFCILRFGLIPDSPFMRNKEKFAWISGGVDPKLKENPIILKFQEILEEETKLFEDSVNKLIEETESSDMIVKVFFCDTCESGTSYCAEVLESQKGTWTCNYCLYENDTKRNQFYIYNKFTLSIFTHLKATKELTFVQDPYIPTAPLKLKGKKVAYSSTLLNKETSPDKIERTIFNSPFMSNMKYHYPDKLDISKTISNFYPSGTDTIEILNVFIGCEII